VLLAFFRWDDDEKTEELKGQDARFIIIQKFAPPPECINEKPQEDEKKLEDKLAKQHLSKKELLR